MSGPKIKVDADVQAVQAELSKVRDQVTKINEAMRGGKAAIDTSAAKRDLDALTKRADALVAALDKVNRAGALNKRHAEDVAKAFNAMANAAGKLEKIHGDTGGWASSWMRQSSHEYRDFGYRPRVPAPSGFYDSAFSIAKVAGSGVAGNIMPYGGVGSSVLSHAIREASGSAGGLASMGGLARILAGTGFGAMAYAGVRGVQGVASAMDPAKSESVLYSDLRQSMGATKVEFEALRDSMRKATDGYAVSYAETSKMAKEFVRTTGAMDDFGEVADQVNVAAGFGRGFGIDPDQSGQFFASARMLGASRGEADSRRLALMIGEAVARGGTSAKMDEVLSSIQGFMTTAARGSFTAPNVEGYAGMMSSLTSLPFDGLYGSPGAAAAMMGKADAALRQGGAFGEASNNFTLGLYQRTMPGFNAMDMELLNEQGAFGSADKAFGSSSPAYLFALHNKDFAALSRYKQFSEAGGGRSMLDMQMAALQSQYGGDAAMFRKAISAHLGVSETEAMALFEGYRDNGGFGGLKSALDRAGADTSKMDARSIASLSQLWGSDRAGIEAQANKLLGMRDVKGADRDALKQLLSGGSDGDLKSAVLKLTSLYDSTKDEGSAARQAQISLDNKFSEFAEQLLPIETAAKEGIFALASKLAPESGIGKNAWGNGQVSKFNERYNGSRHGADVLAHEIERANENPAAYSDEMLARLDELASGDAGRDRGLLAKVTAPSKYDDLFKAAAAKYGVDWRDLKQIAAQESGLRPGADNGHGDRGIMQLNSRYDADRGVTNPFDASENIMIGAKVWADALGAAGGDKQDAFRRYNGSGPAAEAYGRRAMRLNREWHESLDGMDGHLPPAERAKASGQPLSFNHSINVHLLDRNGNPLAEPSAVQTRFGLPMAAGIA